jgi:hypothetical protein
MVGYAELEWTLSRSFVPLGLRHMPGRDSTVWTSLPKERMVGLLLGPCIFMVGSRMIISVSGRLACVVHALAVHSACTALIR